MSIDGRVCLANDPMMLRMWDPEANDRLAAEIDIFSISDDSIYNWRCPDCGHRFSATLNERLSSGTKRLCPACYPDEDPPVSYEESFEALYLVEAAVWDEDSKIDGVTMGTPAAKDLKPGNYSTKIIMDCP